MGEQESRQTTFPLSNPLYDVISILHVKSKALEVYDKFLADVQADNQLRQLLVEIRHDDQRHIERLKEHVSRLLVESQQQAA